MDIYSSLIMIGIEIFNFFPVIILFFLYIKFKTLWVGIAFYTLLVASIVRIIKNYFLVGFTANMDSNGVLVTLGEASKPFYYASGIELTLGVISTLSFLTFAIMLNREK